MERRSYIYYTINGKKKKMARQFIKKIKNKIHIFTYPYLDTIVGFIIEDNKVLPVLNFNKSGIGIVLKNNRIIMVDNVEKGD